MSTRVSAIRVVGGPADRAGLRVPVALAAALACAYLVVAPDSADLAAQEFRAWLFGHAGFTLWDNNWYGGGPPPRANPRLPPPPPPSPAARRARRRPAGGRAERRRRRRPVRGDRAPWLRPRTGHRRRRRVVRRRRRAAAADRPDGLPAGARGRPRRGRAGPARQEGRRGRDRRADDAGQPRGGRLPRPRRHRV